MKLNQLTLEKLVELRTKMILEKKSTKEINFIIESKEREYANSLIEETSATGGPAGSAGGGGNCFSGGVAYGNGGIGGMGPVTGSQPSTLAGSTIGSDWSGNGGTVGSGDVANPFPGGDRIYQKSHIDMGKSHGARTGKKKRVKKLDLKALKNVFSTKQDYTVGSEHKSKRIMNFDSFQKQSLNTITKVKK